MSITQTYPQSGPLKYLVSNTRGSMLLELCKASNIQIALNILSNMLF